MNEQDHSSPRALFINPYYGKWPVWFPAFLLSCKYNPQFSWLIPTDCGIPPEYPDNVIFLESSLGELAGLATEKLGFEVALTRPYKVNDIRPAFGLMFADQLDGYDFWGHCDFDMILGDLGAFITPEILANSDVITARKSRVSGHCTLYRNVAGVNRLFEKHPLHRKAFTEDSSYYFDEVGMTEILSDSENSRELRIHWPGLPFNFADPASIVQGKGPSFVPKYLNRWHWRNGKLWECTDSEREVIYLHFMTWKNSLKHCSIDYGDDPGSFYISYTHISVRKAAFPASLMGLKLYKLLPEYFS